MMGTLLGSMLSSKGAAAPLNRVELNKKIKSNANSA